MLRDSIKQARIAADAVLETKQMLRSSGELCSSAHFDRPIQKGRYGDPVAEVVRIRERLREKLQRQELYSAACHERMVSELEKVPSLVTRNLFMYRYYDRCTWKVAASRAGLGVQAAKMRCERYEQKEREEDDHVA